ncbi:hypothetical protein EYF80_046521 [Liparis tanakae]|uniref:Uncharacterized protein n=1 Tax=Liparis tanakae TaxID=230148 RepID=A0A4Z2FQN1_9TELE|nr:hypothetical protein EYF80_046521 [Liparis tanakae]
MLQFVMPIRGSSSSQKYSTSHTFLLERDVNRAFPRAPLAVTTLRLLEQEQEEEEEEEEEEGRGGRKKRGWEASQERAARRRRD